MKNNTNWQSIGIGIIVITILGLITWGLFHEIGQAPWQFITILIALSGALITFVGNLQIQIRNEQKPKKTEIYDKVINFFFDSILAIKLGRRPKTQEELVQGFADMTPDLILWASDEVLNLYIEFRQLANNNMKDSLRDPVILFGQMLLAMRKDLGHQNNRMTEVSILGTFVNDVEKLSPLESLKHETSSVPQRGNLSRLRGIAQNPPSSQELDPAEDYTNYLTEKYR